MVGGCILYGDLPVWCVFGLGGVCCVLLVGCFRRYWLFVCLCLVCLCVGLLVNWYYVVLYCDVDCCL